MYDLVIRGGTVVDGTGTPAFTADIGVNGDRITTIGKITERSRQIIEADGAIVTPGWIDVHTHYDGQVTWDDHLEGSSANGVTTVVLGNCGVGFAPVATGGVATLIDLMEGVEDIPGTALYEGIPWGEWNTFPEYLSFLDHRSWSVDVAAQIPHGAIRYFVMGDRAVDNEDATEADLRLLSDLTAAAVDAGAVGFSTSRIQGHRSLAGGKPVPGTFAPEIELDAIARGIVQGGGAVMQGIPSNSVGEFPDVENDSGSILDEVRLFGRISQRFGLPFTFTTVQTNEEPNLWRRVLDSVTELNAAGADLWPQVGPRGIGSLTSLMSYHMFMARPTYLKLAHLDIDARVAEMRRPEIKASILAETDLRDLDNLGSMQNFLPSFLERSLPLTFPLTDPVDYEPKPTSSFTGLASSRGMTAQEVMYDFLLEDGGRSVGYIVALNYASGDLEACKEMFLYDKSVPGLSDAGAHVNFQCDMSNPTFVLTHWVRDRTRGERLPLETSVAKLTRQCASLYGMADRGSIAPGLRADLNVIDFKGLGIRRPEIRNDLPAGGSRFLQLSSGYLATVVAGTVARLDDEDTGVRAGRLLRKRAASRA